MLLNPRSVFECVNFARDLCNHYSSFAGSHQHPELIGNVARLGVLLERLDERLRGTRTEAGDGYAWHEPHVGRECGEIIGDCVATLNDCNLFLFETLQFGVNEAQDFSRNAPRGAVEAVDLHSRFCLHAEKIQFILAAAQPTPHGIAWQHFSEIRDEQCNANIRLLDRDHPIPELLDWRFRAASFENCPGAYKRTGQFPLKEGCDALLWNVSLGLSLNGYVQQLHIRKAQWMLRQLVMSVEYRNTDCSSPYRRLILEKASEIWENLSDSSELLPSSEMQLLAIPEDRPFRIWAPGPNPASHQPMHNRPQPTRPARSQTQFESTRALDDDSSKISTQLDQIVFEPDHVSRSNTLSLPPSPTPPKQRAASFDPSQARGQEEKILEVKLNSERGVDSRSHKLVVFRQSPILLRITHVPWSETSFIDTSSDSLLVRYELPQSSQTRTGDSSESPLALEWRRQNQLTGGMLYQFDNLRDLFLCQQALTGFQVHSDVLSVEWSLSTRQKLRPKTFSGTGRLQLWRYKPLSPVAHDHQLGRSGSIMNGSQSTTNSILSTNETISTITRNVNRETFSVEQTSESKNGANFVLAGYEPVHPKILILTSVEGKPTVLCLEMKQGLRADARSCSCRSSPETCRETVIENEGKRFTVRMSSGQVFDIAPFGMAQAPFQQRVDFPSFAEKKTAALNAGHLTLRMRDANQRQSFNARLQEALTLRDIEARDGAKVASGFGSRRLTQGSPPALRPSISRMSQASISTVMSDRSSVSTSTEGISPGSSPPCVSPTLVPARTSPVGAPVAAEHGPVELSTESSLALVARENQKLLFTEKFTVL